MAASSVESSVTRVLTCDPASIVGRHQDEPMRVSSASATDKGLRRSTNEDCVSVREDLSLFVVADGMGGHAAGEVASQAAVDGIGQGSFLTRSFHSRVGTRPAFSPGRSIPVTVPRPNALA